MVVSYSFCCSANNWCCWPFGNGCPLLETTLHCLPFGFKGTLLYGEGQYPQAMDSFQKATTFLAAAHLNLGLTLSALGHVVEAEKVLKHCAVINSDGVKDPKAHMSSVTSCLFNLGNLYVENKRHKGRIQEAKELLIHGVGYNPDRHEVYASLGEVLVQSGDTGKRIEAFEKASQLAPNDENLLLSAAHCLIGV